MQTILRNVPVIIKSTGPILKKSNKKKTSEGVSTRQTAITADHEGVFKNSQFSES